MVVGIEAEVGAPVSGRRSRPGRRRPPSREPFIRSRATSGSGSGFGTRSGMAPSLAGWLRLYGERPGEVKHLTLSRAGGSGPWDRPGGGRTSRCRPRPSSRAGVSPAGVPHGNPAVSGSEEAARCLAQPSWAARLACWPAFPRAAGRRRRPPRRGRARSRPAAATRSSATCRSQAASAMSASRRSAAAPDAARPRACATARCPARRCTTSRRRAPERRARRAGRRPGDRPRSGSAGSSHERS